MKLRTIISWHTMLPVLMGVAALFVSQTVYSQQSSDKKIYTVAYAQDNMANDWRATQVKQFIDFFKAYPHINFIYSNADGSTAKQIQNIEDHIFSKVDVLMTSPRDAKTMTPVIRKAYKKGIPVVLVTRSIEGSDYTSFITPDDENIARHAAGYLARRLKGKGRILILKGVPTATTTIHRTTGFLNELKKYPHIKVAATLTGNYLRGDTIKVMQKVLEDRLQFDAIYAQSDSMASGARLALKKAGINPADKNIVGIDYINEARDAIIHGEQVASFVYPTSVQQAGEIILKILQNKKVPKKVSIPSQLVTQKNVLTKSPIF